MENLVPKFDNPTDLFKPDRGSLTDTSENIYLVVDPRDRSVDVITLHAAARDGTPFEVYYNRCYRVRLPDRVDATQLHDWVENHSDLFETIFDNHSIEWNGSNRVGSVEKNGKVAMSRLKALVQKGRKHPHHSLTNPVYSDSIEQDFDEVDRGSIHIPTHDFHLWEAGEFLYPAKEDVIDDFGLDDFDLENEEEVNEVISEVEQEAYYEGIILYNTREAIENFCKESV